jgi:hypothetical protein
MAFARFCHELKLKIICIEPYSLQQELWQRKSSATGPNAGPRPRSSFHILPPIYLCCWYACTLTCRPPGSERPVNPCHTAGVPEAARGRRSVSGAGAGCAGLPQPRRRRTARILQPGDLAGGAGGAVERRRRTVPSRAPLPARCGCLRC